MKIRPLSSADRHLPIMVQVLLLAVAAVALAQTISFAVILLTPVPPPSRMTLAEAQAALASEAGARASGLDRSIVGQAPLPPIRGASRMDAAAIAYGLGVDPSTVRTRSLAGAPIGPNDDARALVITVPPGGQPFATLETPQDTLVPSSPEMAATLLASQFPLPAFEAAWLRPDGRWVHVAPRTPLISDWRFRLALSLLLGLGVVIPLAWLAARRLTHPIRALATAAGEGRLGLRPAFPDHGPPEIREASTALSAMHGRLEGQFEERMRMLVAIAHDLRTPLTALRLRVETTQGDEHARQVGLIERMERMIREILDYATSSRREAAETVNVSDLAKNLVEDIEAKGMSIRFSAQKDIHAQVPPLKLSRAVGNLVDNAVRYACDIEVSVMSHDGVVAIIVADRGPGVAEGDLERIQEPFERVEASRNRRTGGIGLGLTIARNIAVEMNGDLTLRNRSGGGLVATFAFPAVARDAASSLG